MKKVYLQPRTEDVPLHAGELMIPGMEQVSGGGVASGNDPTAPGAPVRLTKMYI